MTEDLKIMQAPCTVCGVVSAWVEAEPKALRPYSNYCYVCASNRAETVYFLFKCLQLDFKRWSEVDMTGYIDGIYIPMRTVVNMYRCVTVMCGKVV